MEVTLLTTAFSTSLRLQCYFNTPMMFLVAVTWVSRCLGSAPGACPYASVHPRAGAAAETTAAVTPASIETGPASRWVMRLQPRTCAPAPRRVCLNSVPTHCQLVEAVAVSGCRTVQRGVRRGEGSCSGRLAAPHCHELRRRALKPESGSTQTPAARRPGLAPGPQSPAGAEDGRPPTGADQR